MSQGLSLAVVGGGAVGVTAAHDLAVRGADVTLFERDEVASGASGRAAGIVYDAFAEDRDAAVAARALDRFRDLDDEGAISFTSCPYVWFARAGDDRSASAIREQAPRMREHGRDVELLDAAQVSELFPALETAVEGGAVAHDAGYLDPESYVTAMAERARAASVDVQTGCEVAVDRWDEAGVDLETTSGVASFDSVLVAAGAQTKRLLADTGVDIAMKPYRVQALVTDPVDVDAPMTFDATEMYYFRPCEGGLLVGDGVETREADPVAWDPEADAEFVETSLRRVRDAVGADVGTQRAWAGLCTATPDRNPLLGPVDGSERLFVATGWHGHGFMRSPALGEAVAEWITAGEPGSVEAFDPRRFDGDETFDVVEGMTLDE
jgi:glycine/D-amino acid oxidase-like deaminating enzyme